MTERVFFSLSSHPRSARLLSLFLVAANCVWVNSPDLAVYWIVSGACRRRESGRSSLLSRGVSIDLPRARASTRARPTSERAILGIGTATRRGAARRAEPRSRSRSRTRRVRACVRTYLRTCVRARACRTLGDDDGVTTARTRTAN